MVFNAYNTRLVTLLTFVGALLYYEHVRAPRNTEAVVQINDGDKLVNVSLAPEELDNYLKLQQLQFKGKQGGERADSKLFQSPPPPPPKPPSPQQPPPQDLPVEVSGIKWGPTSAHAVNTGAYLPVLKPSNGSFLDTLDISGHKMKERMFLKDRLNIFRRRASVLSEECKIRSNLAKPGPLHLIWDIKHTPNVVWCPNYKVGSTSWMVNFLRLAHFNEHNPDLLRLPKRKREKMKYSPKYGAKQNVVYKLYPEPKDKYERESVFNNSLRMIVVRHPFTRLISAYQDKMQNEDPKPKEHNYLELQHQIIAKYRPKNSKKKSPFPTFSEFIQYVIDSTEKLRTREEWIRNVRCWTPYWAQCNVCASDYNLIMKLETMEQDQKFLSIIADMTELKKLKKSEWRHLAGHSSDDLMSKYMSQITCHQTMDLLQRYMLDFILFDYPVAGAAFRYCPGLTT